MEDFKLKYGLGQNLIAGVKNWKQFAAPVARFFGASRWEVEGYTADGSSEIAFTLHTGGQVILTENALRAVRTLLWERNSTQVSERQKQITDKYIAEKMKNGKRISDSSIIAVRKAPEKCSNCRERIDNTPRLVTQWNSRNRPVGTRIVWTCETCLQDYAYFNSYGITGNERNLAQAKMSDLITADTKKKKAVARKK